MKEKEWEDVIDIARGTVFINDQPYSFEFIETLYGKIKLFLEERRKKGLAECERE